MRLDPRSAKGYRYADLTIALLHPLMLRDAPWVPLRGFDDCVAASCRICDGSCRSNPFVMVAAVVVRGSVAVLCSIIADGRPQGRAWSGMQKKAQSGPGGAPSLPVLCPTIADEEATARSISNF